MYQLESTYSMLGLLLKIDQSIMDARAFKNNQPVNNGWMLELLCTYSMAIINNRSVNNGC